MVQKSQIVIKTTSRSVAKPFDDEAILSCHFNHNFLIKLLQKFDAKILIDSCLADNVGIGFHLSGLFLGGGLDFVIFCHILYLRHLFPLFVIIE